jgi:hypothetical protein
MESTAARDLTVQPGDVQALVTEEHQYGGGPDGVDGHVTAAALGHGLPQGALAGLGCPGSRCRCLP